MVNFKLHTPVGVRDILNGELKIKRELTKRIENIFSGYGYKNVETPMFEYFEVFSDEQMGSTNPKQMYRFFDRKGNELSLRSDLTPPIARIAATAYADSEGPLRFSYTGNVFRYSENYQGKMCELSQVGIELMGVKNTYADGEVVTLAIKSILETGIKEFRLHIGQVEFFKAILEESKLSETDCNLLKDLVAERNYVGIEELIENKNIDENIKNFFIELPKYVGNNEMLKKATNITKNSKALNVLKELEELYEYLTICGLEEYVVFDLGMIRSLNYYTSLIFKGYTYGTGYTLIDGGRYDNLVSQFGKNMPSVGFAIKLNELIALVERNNINLGLDSTRAMIGFNENSIKTALAMCEVYRKKGVSIEFGLIADSFEKNLEYAQKSGIDTMIYFVDNINIKYARMVDGIGVLTNDLTIDDLSENAKEEN